MKSYLRKTGLFLLIINAAIFLFPPASAQTLVEVDVRNNFFDPDNITINVGDTVRWTNNSFGTHNVNGTTAAYPSNPESFGNSVGSSWVYTHVFNTSGDYDYHCDPHQFLGMTGEITVVPVVTDTPSSISSVTASADSICPGTNVTLTPNGVVVGTGATLTWYDSPGGTGNNLGTTPTLMVNPTVTTTYYARLAGTANTVEASVTVTVIPLDDAGFNYASGTYCLTGTNPTPTITGLAGGIFTGTTTLVIDSVTGEIDLAASDTGNYTITYTTTGMCPNSETSNVTITTAPDATFSYAGSPYCLQPGTAMVTFGPGTSGGVFTSSTGLNINATTGEVNIGGSIPDTYTVTNSIAASGGCPAASASASIVINPTYDETESMSICEGETYTFPDGGTTMTDSVHTSSLTTQAGCDSTIVTTLTVIGVDASVTSTNGTLTAAAGGAIYQWIDCNNSNALIAGENGQSFTPSSNGNYAVVVTENRCTDTSACQNVMAIGITENWLEKNFTVFPNPTAGNFSVVLDKEFSDLRIELMDVLGRLVYTTETDQSKTNIILNEPSGLYFLHAYSGTDKATFKLMVNK